MYEGTLKLYLLIWFMLGVASTPTRYYFLDRIEFLVKEKSHTVGGSLILNEEEEYVNKILMGHKLKELDKFNNDNINFPHIESQIQQTEVFKFMQQLPKGSSLHGHFYGLPSQEYLFNLTYTENMYICSDRRHLKFHYGNSSTCKFQPVEELRLSDSGFDIDLKSQMFFDGSSNKCPEATKDKFSSTLNAIKSLVFSEGLLRKHLQQILQEHYDENIMYLELRSTLEFFDQSIGREYHPLDVLAIFNEVIDSFTKNNKGFFGAKIIYTPLGSKIEKQPEQYLDLARQLAYAFPNALSGFDLITGLNNTMFGYLGTIPKTAQLYFHHGIDERSDLTLVDALFMDSNRIRYNDLFLRHPDLLRYTRSIGSSIEICPIAMQVLDLHDIRIHPAVYLMADGYHVNIGNDYPGFWGAKGLSYDWYMAFMFMTDSQVDLRFLKQLAMNSLVYSGLQDVDKTVAITQWQAAWDKFIGNIQSSANFVDSITVIEDSYSSVTNTFGSM